MHDALLNLLRCPFCGTRLSLVDTGATVRINGQIRSGVIGCGCCAFPIVSGIPVLIADDVTRQAVHALEAGRPEDALLGLLGLQGNRIEQFRTLLATPEVTYQSALKLLSVDAEGTYFLYRFSDPTFLVAEAIVRALTPYGVTRNGPILDLCGGCGHLTNVLASLAPSVVTPAQTVITDLYFWKLWLATRFITPGAAAVCCNADAPLPFARDLFSMVVLTDAFPYIWHKRLCADEMARVSRSDGTLLLPHLHNALGANFSAGNTLSPADYRDLFAMGHTKLFSDATLLDDLLTNSTVDLTKHRSPEAIGDEPSLTLVASSLSSTFKVHAIPERDDLEGELIVNPLYVVDRGHERSVLTLTFPTPEYEAEFEDCRRYLPASVTIDADVSGPLTPAIFGSQYSELRRRRILVDAPPRYRD